jgi:hypothetical protein
MGDVSRQPTDSEQISHSLSFVELILQLHCFLYVILVVVIAHDLLIFAHAVSTPLCD